jgi:hypothetical protein
MLVGDVLVKMSADMADLRSGFEQMKDQADKFGKGVSSAADWARNAVVGLAAGLSVSMFANAIREAIDYADKLNDMSQKTGIAVETLGGLGYAAEQSGVNLDTVVSSGVKLAKAMEDAATGGKETSAMFKALGVDVVDASGNLRGIDETMFEVADQFAQMEDGAAKTALAVKLFGKSGADMIPMLNQGGRCSPRGNGGVQEVWGRFYGDGARGGSVQRYACEDQPHEWGVREGSNGCGIADTPRGREHLRGGEVERGRLQRRRGRD